MCNQMLREEIDAVKLSLEVLSRNGRDIEKVLESSIRQMLQYEKTCPGEGCAKSALIQIQAYVELGFPYEMHEELFDEILGLAGTERTEFCREREGRRYRIRPTKKQIRGMLRRWSNSARNPMTVGAVTEDILERIIHKEQGIFFYKNFHAGPRQIPDIYTLRIRGEECLFHDIRGEKYYIISDKNR